eukprot:scaffold162906_cov36-Tisochrysis_lutea.AAC.3
MTDRPMTDEYSHARVQPRSFCHIPYVFGWSICFPISVKRYRPSVCRPVPMRGGFFSRRRFAMVTPACTTFIRLPGRMHSSATQFMHTTHGASVERAKMRLRIACVTPSSR